MKIKSILIAFCMLGSLVSFAQKNEVNKGKASYNKFNEVKSIGSSALGMKDLEAAKTALEKASTNAKTKDQSETWTYLALVYAEYSAVDSINTDEYTKKALDALRQAKSLEGHDAQADNLEVVSRILAQNELNNGVKAFEKQDFKAAYSAFNKGLEYLPGDTLFSYYAGLSAINGQDYPSAIKMYKTILSHPDFSTLDQIYLDLSRLYMMEKDTASAIKYAGEGAEKFPDFADLATQNIELNLQAGNEEKVISNIENEVAKSPGNKHLHYYLGIAYGAIDNDAKAEAAYKKAIELDPNYADAYINLAGFLLNKGIQVFRDASNLPTNQQKEYNEALKKGNELIDEALPFLLKATETAPNSAISWQNLKTYYQLKDNKEKVDEIESKINSL
jgi:tetratricopeptide (TPR) repeat protein